MRVMSFAISKDVYEYLLPFILNIINDEFHIVLFALNDNK